MPSVSGSDAVLNPPRKSFVMIAAFATTLMFGCAAATVWLYLDAGHQAAEAEALTQRKHAQAQMAADFYLASMNRDLEMMVATTAPEDEPVLRAYFKGTTPLTTVYDRQWNGDVLSATTSGVWGETARYEFTANGGKRQGVVVIIMYVPVEQGDEAPISEIVAELRFEKGRWVVTGLDGKSIEEMY